MMIHRSRPVSAILRCSLVLAALGPILSVRASAQDGVDLVIRNARVITLDDRSRIAEAVAIDDGRIVAVGSDEDLNHLSTGASQTIDADGRTLMPGLFDSHVHPLGAATSEVDHPIPTFSSLDAVLGYIADRAEEQPPGTWIVARYAFPTRLEESRFPTRAELDAVAPEHPVLHQGGPAGVANSKALELSGITSETPDPPAGQIVRDPETGAPTGMLRNAYSALKGLPSNAYSARGTEGDDALIADLFGRYNARGITSVADRNASDEALVVYRSLRDRGALTVRVNATRVLGPVPSERGAIVEALGALDDPGPSGEPNGPTGVGDRWVRIGPLKVFLDGGMLNGTAAMRSPWGVGPTYQITDPDYAGMLFVPPEVLELVAEEAARRGWQMTAHIAGERAMDVLLDAYEHADREVGIRGRRWLMTHANFTSADNLQRAAAIGCRRRSPTGLALEGHEDPARRARPRADGLVPPLSRLEGRGGHSSAAAAIT